MEASMDIKILLLLQKFRNGAGSILAEFMTKMTFLGDLYTVVVIMAIVYWCFSKKLGSYILLGWSGNRIVNGFLKVTFCAYRPWIRDASVIPHGNALETATGYSFPSGHSMNAATVFGGVAVRRDMPKLLRATMFIIVFLVAFSRSFLGVHTPQDILIGTICGLLVMWLISLLVNWIDRNPSKDWLVACIGIGLAVLVAIYAAVKTYPEDYDEAGKIIVEGAKMAKDTYRCVGWSIGILAGWLMERRFVNFTTDGISMVTRLTRAATGGLFYYALTLILQPLITKWIPGPAGVMISCFVQLFFVMFIFPWIIVRFEKKIQEKKPAEAN